MDKKLAYAKLVEKRKACYIFIGLSNPVSVEGGILDSDQIGPWSLWQPNLYTEIVVVGQDWGDTVYFKKYRKKRSIDPASIRPVKKWSLSSGMGGHNVPEWVVTMQRNRWSVCSGMSGHYAAEYAPKQQTSSIMI